MRATGRVFGVVLLLLTVGFSSVSGQSAAQKGEDEYYSESGSLNRWTTEMVLRQKTGYFPEFLTVRFGKHRGFDRMVFEVDSDLIGYLVNYGEPPFRAEAGIENVKVRGKAFVEIALYPVTSSDENIHANEKRLAEQNKLRMPLIKEVKRVQWYEAELRYVVGLKRATPFRVQVFSNPTRLVVDFKH